MKMAVYHGIRDLRVEEVEEPKPGQREAKIKVKYCGICGSDLHEYLHGRFPESPFTVWASSAAVSASPALRAALICAEAFSWPFLNLHRSFA